MDHYADDVAAVVKHWRAGRDARGPLDGRRRSGALYRAPRRGQSIQSGADQRGAAADGKTDANPQGTPKRCSMISGAAGRQPGTVLLRRARRPVLRL